MEQGSQPSQAKASTLSPLYPQKELIANTDTATAPNPAEATEITHIESESSRTS